MLVATGALAGVLWFRDLQARGGTATSRRKRRLSALWANLTDETMDAATTYDAAVEYLEMTAQGDSCHAILASVKAKRDHLKYGTGGTYPLNQADREKLLSDLRLYVPTPKHE